jgi:hypothetical protein
VWNRFPIFNRRLRTAQDSEPMRQGVGFRPQPFEAVRGDQVPRLLQPVERFRQVLQLRVPTSMAMARMN